MNILPIKALSWQNAIKSVFTGSSVLHYYEDWIVRSPRTEMQVPAVIMLPTQVKFKRYVGFTKHHLCLRDNFTCQYCGEKFTEKQLTKDHVYPRAFGGPTSWDNIVAACGPCNRDRGHNVKIQPIKRPYRPTYWEMVEKASQHPVYIPHESWGYYIGWKQELLRISK